MYPPGGYDYPKAVESKDTSFPIYQVKDSLLPLDYIREATFGQYFFSAFDEPNLSIRAGKNITFRLIYWEFQPIVINLTEDHIIIKRVVKGNPFPYPDTAKLKTDEKKQYELSEHYFTLLRHHKGKPAFTAYADSLTKLYPKLKDLSHFQKLGEKSAVFDSTFFSYETIRVPISKKDFFYLVDRINKSGYWSLPRVYDCENMVMGVGGFSLEANTPSKYKFVRTASCPNDYRAFTKACQELINYAGLSKDIRLLWDWETE